MAVTGSQIQHEFIVVTYSDIDNNREGYIGIDWSHLSIIYISVDIRVFVNR